MLKAMLLVAFVHFGLADTGNQIASVAPVAPVAEEQCPHPCETDVVGDLNLPYAGPIHVVMFDDYIGIDVGGNIGFFGMYFAPNVRYSGEHTDVTGLGVLTYDAETGQLAISVALSEDEDFVFQMTIRPRTSPVEEVLLDNSDCPDGKKCCECESNQGGSAKAVCDTDERPLCTCIPCCTGTCIKTKVNIEGEF